MTKPVTLDRLQTLWEAALEGSMASREDVLDLIDEIKFLRISLDMTEPELPPAPTTTPVALEDGLMPDPWADEFPGNP